MPVLILSALSRPAGRSFVSLVLILVAAPALFTYRNLQRSAASYNLCFVGPAPWDIGVEEKGGQGISTPGYDPEHFPLENGYAESAAAASPDGAEERDRRRRGALSDLYGTYRTFDGASYYYVKTPFDVTPTCLTGDVGRGWCGWPSAGSLSSALSPRGVRDAKAAWRRSAKSEIEERTASYARASSGGTLSDRDIGTADAGRRHSADVSSASIGWDRGHDPMSRGKNRWCLQSTYLPDGPAEPPVRVKVCTQEVPSIVVDAQRAPFFPELPLSPPPGGIWSVEEASEVKGMGYGPYGRVPPPSKIPKATIEEMMYDGVDVMGSQPQRIPGGLAVTVHCHNSKRTIDTSAGGEVKPGPWDEVKGAAVPRVNWNPLHLPGTVLLCVLFIYNWHRSTRVSRNIVRGAGSAPEEASEGLVRARAVTYGRVAVSPPAELWRAYAGAAHHPSILHLFFVLWNLYWIGATLEEDFGTVTYLYLSTALVAAVAALTLTLVGAQMTYKIGVEAGSDPVHLKTRAVMVGYMSVAFAWSVVAALERAYLVPLPSLDAVVPTVVLLGGAIKFNALPAFNLALARCAAPKSSILSHVAGMLCGIFLHWNMPPHALLVPHVFVPVALLLHLRFVRGVLPLGRGQYERLATIADDDGDFAAGGGGVSASPRRSMLEGSFGGSRTLRPLSPLEACLLPVLRVLMFSVGLASIYTFDHGMAAGQLAVALLFHYAASGRLLTARPDDGTVPSGKDTASASAESVMRAYFLSAAVLIATDAASAGTWFVARVFVTTDPYVRLSALEVAIAMMVRMAVNLAGLVSIAAALSKGDENTDLLGPTFAFARRAGEGLLTCKICGRGGDGEIEYRDEGEVSRIEWTVESEGGI